MYPRLADTEYLSPVDVINIGGTLTVLDEGMRL